MAEEQKTSRVTIKNNAKGARYVHGVDGAIQIAPGETSPPFVISAGELKDAKANADFEVSGAKAAAADTAGAGEGGEGGKTPPANEAPEGTPDDLKDSTKRDGLLTKDGLLEVAQKEGVALESDDNKPTIVQKIVNHRAAVAAKAAEAGTGE